MVIFSYNINTNVYKYKLKLWFSLNVKYLLRNIKNTTPMSIITELLITKVKQHLQLRVERLMVAGYHHHYHQRLLCRIFSYDLSGNDYCGVAGGETERATTVERYDRMWLAVSLIPSTVFTIIWNISIYSFWVIWWTWLALIDPQWNKEHSWSSGYLGLLIVRQPGHCGLWDHRGTPDPPIIILIVSGLGFSIRKPGNEV